MKGKFIVIEGLEGAGKTTSSYIVASLLRKYGINNIICTREPGGTPLAEKLRTIITNDITQKEHITHYTELLILYAARIQLVENVIKPALMRGTWVIGDRHTLSSQAYQGGGRGINHDFILHLQQEIMGNFIPDLTLYLDVTPEISLQRTKKRGQLDRIEKESLYFFTCVRNYYLTLVQTSNNIKTVDASQSQEKVTHNIKKIIQQWLQHVHL
ncbi:dTMP kinase [Candidatus Erwinia haradaeae]|uniref:Thymidylate kinase n=1 Tax=Candidatus Erwinia haradaeae TaxID=1922217 RepID=A0A451D2N5_9GAMM|nr:dTMP kinase [Candidatus Erwinia haradaeae]VFP79909.1 Thymidylate kinase [Candidatus Erwinia haradaeae]